MRIAKRVAAIGVAGGGFAARTVRLFAFFRLCGLKLF